MFSRAWLSFVRILVHEQNLLDTQREKSGCILFKDCHFSIHSALRAQTPFYRNLLCKKIKAWISLTWSEGSECRSSTEVKQRLSLVSWILPGPLQASRLKLVCTWKHNVCGHICHRRGGLKTAATEITPGQPPPLTQNQKGKSEGPGEALLSKNSAVSAGQKADRDNAETNMKTNNLLYMQKEQWSTQTSWPQYPVSITVLE